MHKLNARIRSCKKWTEYITCIGSTPVWFHSTKNGKFFTLFQSSENDRKNADQNEVHTHGLHLLPWHCDANELSENKIAYWSKHDDQNRHKMNPTTQIDQFVCLFAYLLVFYWTSCVNYLYLWDFTLLLKHFCNACD